MAAAGKTQGSVKRWRTRAVFAVTLTIAGPVHAAFGEDVAVLLAQLEQQLQLVSNAISTVQNLVQTVQHLTTVVSNTGAVIKKATSKGGLKMIASDLAEGQSGLNGVLTAAQNVTGLAQDTIYDLNVIGDAVWDDYGKWQADADYCRGKPEKDCLLAQSYRYRQASASLARADSLRLKSLASMSRAFKGLRKMYDVGKESNQIATEVQTEDGVLGAMQMTSRQLALQTTTTLKGNEMAAISAQIAADNYAREAEERQYQRALIDHHMESLGEIRQDPPVDVGWTISAKQWESK